MPKPAPKEETPDVLKRHLKTALDNLQSCKAEVFGLKARLDPAACLEQDLLDAAAMLGAHEIRYIVDTYYAAQKARVAAGNQTHALDKSGEPYRLVRWFRDQQDHIEDQIEQALEPWCDNQEICRWSRSICGVGVILAAGLAAHLSMDDVPRTAQRWWRFAGLDPKQKWLGLEKSRVMVSEYLSEGYALEDCIGLMAGRIGTHPETLHRYATTKKDLATGEYTPIKMTRDSIIKACAKRPWNAALKTLTWKLGVSFVKVQSRAGDFYGKVYANRKAQELQFNDEGKFAGQAADKLREYHIGKDTDAYKWYSKGKLPPAHLDARAKRWAVKLFLSHYHEVAWRITHHDEAPPAPYPIGVLGHTDYIPPPNWPMK